MNDLVTWRHRRPRRRALDPIGRGALDPIGRGALDPIGRGAPTDLPCQQNDADLWFSESPLELERAKALCRGCPARLACLAGAAERHEPIGVWGGEIFDHGRVVTHKRSRGRPRKDSITPRRLEELPVPA